MKILITEKTRSPAEALNMLKNAGHELLEASSPALQSPDDRKKLEDADAILCYSFTKLDKDTLAAAKNLTHIVSCTTGLDHIDTGFCKQKGIHLIDAAGANADAVAEHTIALLFAALRKIPHADATLRAGQWVREPFSGEELEGKTFGFLGFGRIGKLVAKKLRGFDLAFLVYDPYLSDADVEKTGKELGVSVKKVGSIETVLKNSQIVSLHLPLTPETKNMIGKKEFALMRNAIFLNTSRGGIVDEQALADALQNGQLLGAGLDVFSQEPLQKSPLLSLPNAILTPHIATMTTKASWEMAMTGAKKFLESTANV